MKITIKNRWEDITLADMEKITDLQSVKMPDEEKMMDLISILTGINGDELAEIPMTDIITLSAELNFLAQPIPKKVVNPKPEICGRKFYHILNPEQILAGQFLDYKIILEQEHIDRKLARLIACFTIPEGHTYNDGYDTDELVDFLNENLSVVEGQSLVNFFTIQFNAYSAAILTSSIKKLKQAMKKAKTYNEKQNFQTAIKIMKKSKEEILAQNTGLLF